MQRDAGWTECWACLPLARWAASLFEQMHWNVLGGGGERTSKVDSGDVRSPPPLRLPAWRGTGTVCASLSPRGKFRAAWWLSLSSATAKWLKGEGSPAGRAEKGVCVCVLVSVSVLVCVSVAGRARPRGGACGCDVVGAGRALPRASATAGYSEGLGWTELTAGRDSKMGLGGVGVGW